MDHIKIYEHSKILIHPCSILHRENPEGDRESSLLTQNLLHPLQGHHYLHRLLLAVMHPLLVVVLQPLLFAAKHLLPLGAEHLLPLGAEHLLLLGAELL